MEASFRSFLDESVSVQESLRSLAPSIELAARKLLECLRRDNTLLICGNGGSAAEAQHMAAEFTGRYKLNRRGLPALALTTDSSALTAIGNDFGFDEVFAKQVEGLCRRGDVLLGLSTSGHSSNILRAVEEAKKKGAFTIGLLGRDGGALKTAVDLAIVIPSENTSRIQEAHLFVIHALCEVVEKGFFEKR